MPASAGDANTPVEIRIGLFIKNRALLRPH